MPTQTMLSWNIQGQNPLSSLHSFGNLAQKVPADVHCLCEVGEPVLYELFAHEWIKAQAELDAVAPFFGKLDGEGQARFKTLSAMVTMQTRYYPGSINVAPAFIAPAEGKHTPVSADIRNGRFRSIADSLRESYSTAAMAVRDAHDLLRREIKMLKLELRMIGADADWHTPRNAREQEKHDLLQRYSYYVQIVPQENRHYLILRNASITGRDVDVGGKRPLLCLNGTPELWYLHAIANKSPAKKQILAVVELMRQQGGPLVFLGDLNKDRADLLKEAADALKAPVIVAGCGKATQKSGGELDYAIGIGLTALKVERVELVDSDHYPILVTAEFP